ncbi:MAG TPA: DUF624 domain-containing protein [Anaerolineae bacterium]|nr:DUF624 domain-containing protein [Anaerolineae bacterium]
MPGFVDALHVLQQASRRWWFQMPTLILLNVTWFVLQLLLVTGPPATAAMFALTNRAAHGQWLEWRDFWGEFRRFFGHAWAWGAMNLAVVGLIAFNFAYFGGTPGPFWRVARLVWVSSLAVWFTLQLYYWPFLVQGESHGLGRTLIASARMALQAPVFTLTLGLVLIAIAFACLFLTLPVAIFVMAYVGLVSSQAFIVQQEARQRFAEAMRLPEILRHPRPPRSKRSRHRRRS